MLTFLARFPVRLLARLLLAVRREAKAIEAESPEALARTRFFVDAALAMSRRDQATHSASA
jgi:hypothetical protein